MSLDELKCHIWKKPRFTPLKGKSNEALRKADARSGRVVADLVRDAIRKILLKPQAIGRIAILDGEPKRASIEHDSIHDEP